MFYQSKFGRDLGLQNTHIGLFKSARDVMQVNTISAQLGLGSQIAEWYRQATSLPYGQSLIDLSPRIAGWLRNSTNNGSISSICFIPELLKLLKSRSDEYTKCFLSAGVPIIFPQVQNSIPWVSFKRVYPVSLRRHNKSTPRKPGKHKKTSHGKVSKQVSTIVLRTNNMEAKKGHFGVRKRLTAHKSHYSFRH